MILCRCRYSSKNCMRVVVLSPTLRRWRCSLGSRPWTFRDASRTSAIGAASALRPWWHCHRVLREAASQAPCPAAGSLSGLVLFVRVPGSIQLGPVLPPPWLVVGSRASTTRGPERSPRAPGPDAEAGLGATVALSEVPPHETPLSASPRSSPLALLPSLPQRRPGSPRAPGRPPSS